MSSSSSTQRQWHDVLLANFRHGIIPPAPLTVVLSALVGLLAGYGSTLFGVIIDYVNAYSVEFVLSHMGENWLWYVALVLTPALGLLLVSWLTDTFAPEAEGHGIPEVITAVARNDGYIRARVAAIKIVASGICIGTGGSMGREGPIVQIGAAFGSMFGRLCKLSPQNVKTLVAAGGAAGIAATFNAPLAGVIFSSEIILGSFAVESLTPLVVAAVLADVVQTQLGAGDTPFPNLHYNFEGRWDQLPSYMMLGLVCGGFAVAFTKMVYFTDDLARKYLPRWWMRALLLGSLVGLGGLLYPATPPSQQGESSAEHAAAAHYPPLFGMGHEVIHHTLHLEETSKESRIDVPAEEVAGEHDPVSIDPAALMAEFWWLLPLAFLKPLVTSLTLSGGGSGGIFAPSLFIGATAGAAFGVLCNIVAPGASTHPGAYAIVGMGAVVAGTTHGTLSAILIVYEMTNDYHIILPIMIAAGLASMIAEMIDPESIYYKKLSRRGEFLARGHDMHRLEHVMVRDVMVRVFPSVHNTDNLAEIIQVARDNPHFECLPVMNDDGKLTGIIRPEDLHRLLDTDLAPHMLNADDVAISAKISVAPDENLIEALRDFGKSDVETLPVESRHGNSRRLVGLLLRSDVMRRYREELLQH